MTKLKEFLSNRRNEIESQIEDLRIELQEIEASCAAIRNVSKIGDQPSPSLPKRTRLTLKKMVIGVLEGNSSGADAQLIISLIKEKYGKEIARESLSPQISRLGQDGILRRDGSMWSLVQKNVPIIYGQEDETSTEEASKDSCTEWD
jgi:hypothetical protein